MRLEDKVIIVTGGTKGIGCHWRPGRGRRPNFCGRGTAEYAGGRDVCEG